MNKNIDAWLVIRDNFIIDGVCDDEESANNLASYNRRNYLGTWKVKHVKNLKKVLKQASKITEDMELCRAARELTA